MVILVNIVIISLIFDQWSELCTLARNSNLEMTVATSKAGMSTIMGITSLPSMIIPAQFQQMHQQP